MALSVRKCTVLRCCLSVCRLSVCLYVCVSVSHSVHSSVCLSVCLSLCHTGQLGAGSNATISEEMYRASLLSAVEDKIRRRLREVFDQAQVNSSFVRSFARSWHAPL